MYNSFEKHNTQETHDRDPQAVAELNDAYNSRLYGHIGKNHLAENPSLSDEGYTADASDRLFTEAAMIAADHGRDLDQNKEYDDGMMTVRASFGDEQAIVQRTKDEFRDNHPGVALTKISLAPEKIIDDAGDEVVIQKELTETAPGRWDTTIAVVSGDASALAPEYQAGSREMTHQEVAEKDSILNKSTIDPEQQKDLSNHHAAPTMATAPSPAVEQLAQEAYKLAA
ncbi:MAG: hypothetical protein Q4A34_03270 [Candidatus Saccharibacteria bacterium]|nr:hypothetical protein [Candidatus Saccharibacteria bacterium]